MTVSNYNSAVDERARNDGHSPAHRLLARYIQTRRLNVMIAAHDERWSLTTSLRSNRVSTISHVPKCPRMRNV